MKLAEVFAGFLFPHKCFLCGDVLGAQGWLCGACALPKTGDELCPHCAKPREECLCAGGAFAFDFALAPLYYTDEAAFGIHRFKYDGRRYYAAFLGDLMAQCAADSGASYDVVTYVPMAEKKRRRRGFCQSELLAREVAKALHLPVAGDCLRHTGRGGVQMEQKSADARRKNAQRSFAPGVRKVPKKHVLLVDDVLTTGATASCCAGILKEQGAARVTVLCAVTTRENR